MSFSWLLVLAGFQVCASCIGVRVPVPKMVSKGVQIGCKLVDVAQMSRGERSQEIAEVMSRRDRVGVWACIRTRAPVSLHSIVF